MVTSGQAELNIVGRDPEVAGERKLEPDSEDVATETGDHRLRAPLGRRDVPRELRDLPRAPLEEARDVAAGGEGAARAGEDDEAHRVVPIELDEQRRELVARGHRDAVELPGHVERDRRDAALVVTLEGEPVVVAHTRSFRSFSSSRRTRRRILPEALFGSSGTNRYSRGRLKRASGEARQCASSSSAFAWPTTTATTR